MIGSRVNPPLYTPRLPIGGSGGVFQPSGGTPYKPFSPSPFAETLGGIGQILEGFRQKKELKRQRELEERKFALLEDYRRAQIEKMRQPLRPERPTRAGQIGEYMAGLESGGEEWLRAAGIGETEVSPFGRPPWHRDPRYSETEAGRVAAGLEPRAGRVKERTVADVIKDISNLPDPENVRKTYPELAQMIDIRRKQLEAELMELQGMEIEEKPSPAKESWMPFGWGDVPEGARPPTRKVVPKKVRPGLDALAEKSLMTGKDVPEEYRRMGVKEYRPPSSFQPMKEGVMPERLKRVMNTLKGPDPLGIRGPEPIPANLEANVGLEAIASTIGRGYARGDRPGTYLPFDKGYTGQERPGTRLPFDPGFTGAERPGVHLPWDAGYTGDERPGVRLPFDEGYVAPRKKVPAKVLATKAGKPATKEAAKGRGRNWREFTAITREVPLSEMSEMELKQELEKAPKVKYLEQLRNVPGVKPSTLPYGLPQDLYEDLYYSDLFGRPKAKHLSSTELDMEIKKAELAAKVAALRR